MCRGGPAALPPRNELRGKRFRTYFTLPGWARQCWQREIALW
jgi:hypothetical protein